MAFLAAAAPYVSTALTVAQALKKTPKTPKAPLMPIPDDELVKRDRRRALAQQQRGRTSTILTETDGLGG